MSTHHMLDMKPVQEEGSISTNPGLWMTLLTALSNLISLYIKSVHPGMQRFFTWEE